MKRPRLTEMMRGAVVILLLCSWLAISNHCAIAAVMSPVAAAPSECPFHSKPKKQAPVAQQCCKTLRAVVAKTAKSWARDDAGFTVADLSVYRLVILADAHSAAPLLLDTGPPGVRTFAELILQRSLLAHAPPSRV